VLKQTQTLSYKDGIVDIKAEMIQARRAHSTVYHKDFVYVFGGTSSVLMSHSEKYSISENIWYEIAELPRAATLTTAVAFQNALYVFGGYDWNEGMLDIVQRYDIVGDQWELLNVIAPKQFQCAGVFVLTDETILVLGGTIAEEVHCRQAYVYNVAKNEFKEVQEFEEGGWTIYPMLRKDDNVYLFTRGEDCKPPEIRKYCLVFQG